MTQRRREGESRGFCPSRETHYLHRANSVEVIKDKYRYEGTAKCASDGQKARARRLNANIRACLCKLVINWRGALSIVMGEANVYLSYI